MTATIDRPPAPAPAPRLSARARRLSELTGRDRILRGLLLVAAIIPFLALIFLAYEMFKQAYPAIVFNGWHFFTTKAFSLGNLYATNTQTRHGYHAPPGASYGILPLVFGTLVCSLIALVLAVPVSIGAAIFLVEKLPPRFQGGLGVFIELLAGIPSVLFGLWGDLHPRAAVLAHRVQVDRRPPHPLAARRRLERARGCSPRRSSWPS